MTQHGGNDTASWYQTVGEGPLGGLPSLLLNIVIFVALVVATVYAGRGLRALAGKLRRRPPTAGALLGGKITMMMAVLIVAGTGLTVLFDVDLLSVFATLGIVSLALGFGLQNTVANMAAGMGLSIDRPFEVGDRIRVGTTWGDVESIGLRSTRILTTSGELVAIPNAVLDTQEVWNNTHEKDVELRLELPFSISYDSSVELAESLILKAARRHERVLAYPEPRVQVKALGADGIDMELRVWIDQARIRANVEDRMYRSILRDFDENGVIIPYPHQVNVESRDLPEPAPTPEFLTEAQTEPLVLIATRGSAAAQAMAAPILKFVKGVGARAIVLHVRSPAMRYHQLEADKAINAYMVRARQDSIKVHPRAEVGEVQDVIAKVAREEGARLIILGQSMARGRNAGWVKNEVAATARSSKIPVLPLQTHLEQSDEFMERWYKRLRPEPVDDDDDDD